MNDQSEAAIAALEITKHANAFLEQLDAAMRFMRAMRILWLYDEAKRLEAEAESIKWKLPSGYLDNVRKRADSAMKEAS